MITQLSVFLRNKPGELSKVTAIIKENNIDVCALTVVETADYGILRVLVNKTEELYSLLQQKNFLVGKTEIIAVKMADESAGLNRIANIFGKANINIEYIYGFSRKENIILLIQVNPDHQEKALEILKLNSIEIYSSEDICKL